MTANIIALSARRKPTPQIEAPEVQSELAAIEVANDFVENWLYPWAVHQGLDIDSYDFKRHGALISMAVQLMVAK